MIDWQGGSLQTMSLPSSIQAAARIAVRHLSSQRWLIAPER
jgi:hypothetical protein